jgi:hypothetical protein
MNTAAFTMKVTFRFLDGLQRTDSDGLLGDGGSARDRRHYRPLD